MSQRDADHSCKHPPPHKHVLLLSCMDTRLLDNTVTFMNEYNLQNRYDQVVFAGAALGVQRLGSPPWDDMSQKSTSLWKDVFFHHLQVALDVLDRKIKDIFILEHRDCGAYEHFHPKKKKYKDTPKEQAEEEEDHRFEAFTLAADIKQFCQEQLDQATADLAQGLKDLEAATSVKKPDPTELEEKVLKIAQAKKKLEAWDGIQVRCFLMDLSGKTKHLCHGEDHESSSVSAKKQKGNKR